MQRDMLPVIAAIAVCRRHLPKREGIQQRGHQAERILAHSDDFAAVLVVTSGQRC
jgi:hypothetical protein